MHTVASLLKLYLRELPEPVIPFHKYDEFLACAKLPGKDDEMVRQHFQPAASPSLYSSIYFFFQYLSWSYFVPLVLKQRESLEFLTKQVLV